MGGILPTPKAPALPTYTPLPEVDTRADEMALRLDAMERRRRGRGSTVLTSQRGLVRQNEGTPQKKTLLGE